MTVRSRTSAGAFLALALLAGLLALLPTPAAASTIPSISEIHYDDGGADADEGVEVVADPGSDLTGYRLVPVNGSGGAVYTPQVTMSGTMPASGAKWFPITGLQNGSPDGIALFSPTNQLLEFLSYEGSFVGVGTGNNLALNGVTSTDIGVAEAGTEADGLSLQKVDGTWIGPRASSHDLPNLPDEPVDPEEPGTCTGAGFTHTIAQVQGTGAATPVPGAVKVAGVVTGTYLTGGLNGMTIQTAGTGGPGRTVAAGTASDGIFVYFGTDAAAFPDVSIGDAVEVTGSATEFNAVTQITTASLSATAVCSEGNALPAATPLTLPLAADAKESAESMLVAPTGTYTISDTYQSDRFGEIILAAGTDPAPIPTDLFAPGSPEAIAQKTTNTNGRVLLDDGRSTNLVSTGELPSYYGPTTGIRAGDQVAAFGPVTLTFGFDEWRFQPTTPVTNGTPAAQRTTFTSTNPRPPAPADVLGSTGDLKVGSFNVLNYFVDFGGDARGADNPAALAKQQAKIVSAIVGLDADVLALEEIENSIRFTPAEPQKALATLVAALNAAEGPGTWAYVGRPAELPGAASEDVITTAIIYKPAAATPVGDPRSINDETVWFNAREPIAQTFTSGDATFTVVANHLKSKSPGDNPPTTGDNADIGDGQGTWNGDRLRQVASLVDFVEDVKADSGSDDVLMFGDFNAYTQEDPMRALYDEGYLDLGHENPTGHHSYVFSGEEGSLDHAVASPSLNGKVTGFDIWEINAHEPYPFQYDANAAFYVADQYRASDHNPELVGLDTDVAVEPVDPVDIQLLTINDFHGRLVSPGNTAANATPPNSPIGGAAQLAGLIDQQRALNPNTAFVAAGDNIGASTFVSGIQDDNPTLETLDAMGLDVSSVGNHEFDKGIADLTGRVDDNADFPYLAANVFLDGQPALDPYLVQDLGGVEVGYVGVVTEQLLSLVSPGGMEGVTVTDPVAAAEQVAAQLKDGNEANGEADIVVVLAHEGADGANAGSVAALEADPVFGEFMAMSNDVDVIMSGHTHIPFAYVATKPNGDPRPVVEAEEYGKKLGKVTLTVDPSTGEVTDPAASLIDVVGKPINATIKSKVDGYVATATTLGSVPVGSVTADIKRAYVGSTTSDDRGTESVMGNFIADVQLEGTAAADRGGAQIAFMNAGGLRKDILFAPDGVVTYSELYDVQPFANDLITKTYTGAQIKAALEQQWQPAGAARPILWLGVSKGFTYTYDPAKPQGSRINASSMELNGTTISPTGTYRVAINGFLATGGDNFAALAGGTDRMATGDNDLIVLKKYFEDNSPVTADTAPRTSVQVVPDTVDIQLLGINDFHGRIETVPTSPPAAPANNGGAAELAAVVDAQRALNPNTGFVAAGDNIGASTFVSAIDGDNPTLDVLDEMGLNASAVGNHELDKGFVDLRDRVQARADFPYLAANIYEGSTRPFDAYSVQDIGGAQVGYVGVVTQQTPSLVSPGGIATLTFTDPVAEAEAVAAQLKDGNPANGEADIVVLLAHEGADSANAGSVAALEADPVFGEFMAMSNDVDVIFSGHTHIPFSYVATKPNGDPRPVVEAEEYGRKLGKVTLTVDPATGDITNPTASLLTVQNVSPVNADVKAIVDAAKANAQVLGAQPLGSITADIKRDPNRAAESDAANFIADVQLDATKDPGRGGAQIALMNPGGVRNDFLFAPDGVITYSEAFAVQSFSNDVVTKTYTGAQIKQVLEEQWQPAGAARPKLGLGISKGFTFSYNPNGLQGNRVVANSMVLNGVRMKLTNTYRVTVNVFLATGGDNFSTLGQGTDQTTTGDNDLQMLVDYFDKYSPVTADVVKRTTAVSDSRVEGVVTKVVDGASQPMAGMQVRLYKDGVATGSSAATTDAQGRYTFAPVAPGTYQVWFRSNDPLVASEWYHDATSQAEATDVVVGTGTRVTVDEVLTYTPPIVKSSITGVVTGPDGTTPLAGIQVRAYPLDGGAAKAATTDAQGRYTITNLLQGEYKLWFRVVSASTPYVSEYHADQATLVAADPVTLTATPLTVDASLAAKP